MIGFSLEYGGKYYHSDNLTKMGTQTKEENGVQITEEIYMLDCLRFIRTHKAYPCGAEYSLFYLENLSNTNSKQITRIWDIDSVFTNDISTFRGGRGMWGGDDTTQIHMSIGCTNRSNEYQQIHEPIGPRGNYYCNAGGRSSAGLLPFFELRNEDAKVATILAIGWSSQWQVFFDKNEKGNNRICAGIPNLNFHLKPHEKIRTASVLIYDYIGERDEAHVVWRRLLRDHFAMETRVGGSKNMYGSWGGQSDEFLINKAQQFIDAGFKFDIAHFDAGWYGKCPVPTAYVWDDGNEHSGLWAKHVGDWEFNEILHPTHMKEAVEKYRELASLVGFWSEFERAYKDSDTVKAHPEYYFKTPLGDNYLVNLGSDIGFEYAWKSISLPALEVGANTLDVDFNVDPLVAFDGEDEPDRKGISQIKYVMNLYKLFDKFTNTYQNAIVTNCASGMRRMDIEMMQRTVQNHRSDTHCRYDFPCNESQSHGAALAYWLPYNVAHMVADACNVYRFRSSYASGIGLSDLRGTYSEEDLKKAKENYDEYLTLQKYANKDFYPVFGFSREECGWGGWQYFDPDENDGFLMAFRRKESLSDTVNIRLKGLKDDTIYAFKDADGGETWTMSGKEAKEDFKIIMKECMTSRLIRYHKI